MIPGAVKLSQLFATGEDAISAEGITSTETRYLKEKSCAVGWSLGPQPAR